MPVLNFLKIIFSFYISQFLSRVKLYGILQKEKRVTIAGKRNDKVSKLVRQAHKLRKLKYQLEYLHNLWENLHILVIFTVTFRYMYVKAKSSNCVYFSMKATKFTFISKHIYLLLNF